MAFRAYPETMEDEVLGCPSLARNKFYVRNVIDPNPSNFQTTMSVQSLGSLAFELPTKLPLGVADMKTRNSHGLPTR
jgi:hypothetical protein